MTASDGYDDSAGLGNTEPDDLLSPHHYRAVRGEGADMRSLPLWCYTSERFWAAEKERVFLRRWNMLEREELVPAPGDFHCLEFLGLPLLMVRGRDEQVRVFANTCRHRGALVAEGSGNCKAFRCPYHFWTYNLDGSFNGAPNYKAPDGRPLIDDANRHEFGLVEIESGTWGGFVFVRLRTGGESLAEHLGVLAEALETHRLEDMRRARKVVYDMDANWKCFVENYIDSYHIPYVHKDSLSRWKNDGYLRFESTGQEFVGFARHEGSQLLLPFEGYDGFPPMPQLDEYRRGTFFTTLKPGVMMTIGNDGALVFQSEPVSATKSRLTVSSLFPAAYFERDDFERLSENYYRRNAQVVVEDKDIALRQYAGLRSPYARIARLCALEKNVSDFANWIVDEVIGPERGQAKAGLGLAS